MSTFWSSYWVMMLLICTGISSSLWAQKAEDVSDSPYLILMETRGDSVQLTCKSGCQWEKASFVLKKNKIISISDKSVAKTQATPKPQAKVIKPFTILIKRTDKGYMMQGENGTRWGNASFTCIYDCSVFIDIYGLIDYY